MKHRTHRLRRVAGAIALGVGGVGGVIGLAAGNASAATPRVTIKATSAPNIGKTGTDLAAGSLTLTIPAGAAATATNFTLHVGTAQATSHVDWAAATVSHTAGSVLYTAPTGLSHTFVLTVTKSATTADTIHITGIEYNTATAAGTVTVTPSATGFKFSPTSVVNAKAPGKPATFFTTAKLTATATPPVSPTGNGQAAGTWTISLKGAKTTGWIATESFDIILSVPEHAGDNCTAGGFGYVLFTGTPTVKVSSSTKTSTTPTVSASTKAALPCTGANHDELVITATNSGTLTGTTGTVTLSISGVKYDVGGGVAATNVYVTTTIAGLAGAATDTSATTGGASNAVVATAFVTANTPPVTVKKTAYAAAISPVELVENVPGTVPSGYVCLSLGSGSFNPLGTASAKVANSGDGVVTSKVTYENGAGGAATTTTSATYARFEIKTSSTTKASTYEVSGLDVNATSASGPDTVTVKHVAVGTNCLVAGTSYGSATAFSVGQSSTQIYGATADATAAAEFSTAFPHTGAATSCPHTRVAVLATDEHFPDALSSAALASSLTTGTLLTPTSSLSSVTLNQLRVEGIKQVDVVGGNLAVSTTVVNQLETTPVYACGGRTLTTVGGKQAYISVDRIAGPTQYGTADQVARYVDSTSSLTIPGAYLGANPTRGTGAFNDTAGTGSPAPGLAGALKTVIVASGQEFQDAESASVLSYRDGIPIVLTPATSLSATAVTAIHYLGAQQVILLGGPFAVTNTVANKIETTTGASVVRIAGKDATDTAVQLADFEVAGAHTGAGWDPHGTVMVSRGNGYTDGLAGAVIDHGHTNTWPLLLTENPTTVGTYLTTFLKEAGKTGIDGTAGNKISSLTILGGPLAVTPATISQMQTDLQH